jgi:hypothetical protein
VYDWLLRICHRSVPDVKSKQIQEFPHFIAGAQAFVEEQDGTAPA